MSEGPYIAEVAALIGDPARANMLCALMDGRAHTAAELAYVGGVGAPTASAHLGKLVEGGLLAVEKQGRHRYYRLASAEAALAIEALGALVPAAAPRLRRTGPRDAAMRHCRTCYDHLAGEVAVALVDAFAGRGWMREDDDSFVLTEDGAAALGALGLDIAAARNQRRRFAPRCLDWSERRAHLGGALGAQFFAVAQAAGWMEKAPKSRVAVVTAAGAEAFRREFGLDLPIAAAA